MTQLSAPRRRWNRVDAARACWNRVDAARASLPDGHEDPYVIDAWWDAIAEIVCLEDRAAEAARFKAAVLQVVANVTGEVTPGMMLALSLARDVLSEGSAR